MNRTASLLCFALCAACFTLFANAATFNVPAQYATIQAAVTAANTGDTVLVADGTYTGAGNRNVDFGSKDLIVQSASGIPANCVIDCQKSGCAFILQNNQTAKSNIAGFTITNGTGFSVQNALLGGGIYVTAKNINPTVTNCVMIGNSATDGGGMYYGTATNCVFTGNKTTDSGGGMTGGAAINCAFTNNTTYNAGGGMTGGTATNCVFTGNSTVTVNTMYPVGLGGGMIGGTATNCVFTNNSANSGGGVYRVTATNCVFTNNTANSGGGMYSGAATNCVFINNSAVSSGMYFAGSGGGMYGGAATNCVFTGNSANGVSFGGGGGSGGGIAYGAATNCVLTSNAAVSGGGAYETSLYFCTVANNTAQTVGGGIYVYTNMYSTGYTLTNCIVWGNTASGSASSVYVPSGSTFPVANSDIQGGYVGAGNINADPLFVNQATNNLRLKAGSPCINGGVPIVPTAQSPYTFASPTTDLDGGNRIVGAAPDMGAYEAGNVGVFGTLAFFGIAANAPAQNVTFQFRPVSGGAAIVQTYFTTSDGAFYLYGVPDGSYNLWIKSPTYLATLVPVTVSGGTASVTATLQPGDCNNDNACDATDFGIFVSAYNTFASVPGSGYDPTADLNGDGNVDPTDFGLLIGSYNTQGAP